MSAMKSALYYMAGYAYVAVAFTATVNSSRPHRWFEFLSFAALAVWGLESWRRLA